MPDLFAGKMHAFLFRKWGNRVKGRYWYDMEWYIQKGVPLHLGHLAIRAHDSGDWPIQKISREEFFQLVDNRIKSVSINRVKEDVLPFIKNYKKLDIWSPQYFQDISKMIRFTE